MDSREIKQIINNRIQTFHDELAAHNDDLADHPEVSGQEYESSRKIVALLLRHGFTVEYPYGGFPTAFHGVYGDRKRRYQAAVLVEYDALPELGHACGHCLSGSISLLAALALQELQDELNCTIHVIGTPLEEDVGAKCEMVERGYFNGYDMAGMVHLYNVNLIAPKLQAMASFEYTFRGKAAHASAAPWDGVNALNAVQLLFHAVDMMRQHVRPDAQFHAVIRNGGAAPGIVPETASAEFWVRSQDKTYLQELIQRLDNCAAGAALATGTTWNKHSTAPAYDNLKPNPFGTGLLKEIYGELGLEQNGDPNKIFGSSDAGNVSFVCPAFHPCLQVVEPEIAIHTRQFAESMKSARAHEALDTGARILAFLMARIFQNSETVERLKRDFQAL